MKRRLELGSGYVPYRTDDPEWEHLDLNPSAPHVEHVADLSKITLPFSRSLFQELRAVDVLEHLSYRDTDRVLDEWFSILVPGGRIFIQVPDAEWMIRRAISYADAACPPFQLWPQPVPAALGRAIAPGFVDRPLIDSLAWFLLGGHRDGDIVRAGGDWRLNAHYALFSEASLRWHLEKVGFEVESITRNAHPNLLCWARRP